MQEIFAKWDYSWQPLGYGNTILKHMPGTLGRKKIIYGIYSYIVYKIIMEITYSWEDLNKNSKFIQDNSNKRSHKAIYG